MNMLVGRKFAGGPKSMREDNRVLLQCSSLKLLHCGFKLVAGPWGLVPDIAIGQYHSNFLFLRDRDKQETTQ
jgi:hypothetical protein